jgi:hypothetical protein
MSFLLLATAVAVAAGAAGAFIARRSAASKEPAPPAPVAPAVAAPPAGLESLPVTLGDVVSIDTPAAREERWLEGVIVAREGKEIVGALFVAPEGRDMQAVAAFAPPRKQIAWLTPADVAGLSLGGAELPSTLEIGGAPMRRRARLPVSLERAGRGAPAVDSQAIWAEYEAAGRAVTIILQLSGRTLAWSGLLCDPGEYERMGSGDAA